MASRKTSEEDGPEPGVEVSESSVRVMFVEEPTVSPQEHRRRRAKIAERSVTKHVRALPHNNALSPVSAPVPAERPDGSVEMDELSTVKDDSAHAEDEYTYDDPRIDAQKGLGEPLWWYPWPRKPENPVADEDRVDPLEQGLCWWLTWVVVGAHASELKVDYPWLLEWCANKYGWRLPPIGRSREWRPFVKFEIDSRIERIWTVQSFFSRIGITHVLRALPLPEWRLLYMLVLVLAAVVMAQVWGLLVLFVIPLGDPFADNDFSEHAVWLFVMNPLVECTVAFMNVVTSYGCVDYGFPWRPFLTHTLPVLVAVYVAEVLVMGSVVLTVGTFPMQMILSRAVSIIVTAAMLVLLRRHLFVNFDYYGDDDSDSDSGAGAGSAAGGGSGGEKPDEAVVGKTEKRPEQRRIAKNKANSSKDMDEESWRKLRFHVFWLMIQLAATLMYIGYALASKKLDRSILYVLILTFSILAVVIRKIVQRQAVIIHKDMAYIVSGAWIYSLHALFLIFSSPNFGDPVGNDKSFAPPSTGLIGAWLFLFLTPCLDIFLAFFKQSEFWYRFRCFTRSLPKCIFCLQWFEPYIIPVEEDMDHDGRGVTNAHPDYRRCKTHYSFYSFYGTLTSYTSFLVLSEVLQVGPNKHHYPFNALLTRDDITYSQFFSVIVILLTLAGFYFYHHYLCRHYPVVCQSLSDLLSVYQHQPFLLGFLFLIITSNTVTVMSIFMASNRVWYADLDSL